MVRTAKLASVAAAVFVAACTPANYGPLVTDFDQNVSRSSAAIANYYAALNDLAREAYLDRIVYAKELALAQSPPDTSGAPPLSETDNGKPTALVALYNPDSIQARLDSLQLIAVYGQKLTALATSSAPDQFVTASQALGGSLQNLGTTIGTLSQKDNSLTAYAGPVTALIGAIGQMYLQAKQEEAIKTAVNSAAQPVNDILDALERDLRDAIVPLEQRQDLQALSNRVLFYNVVDQQLTREEISAVRGRAPTISGSDLIQRLAERQALANAVRDAAAQYALASQLNPTELVGAIRTAHNALIKYANSDRKPENLMELATAFETFRVRVNSVATPISDLRKLATR